MLLIADLLKRQSTSEKIAIKFKGEELTYKEWYKRALILSNNIEKELDHESKTVALLLPNSINYAVTYFGAMLAQKVVVPIGVQSTSFEIISTLKYCEIDCIITNSFYRDNLLKGLSSYDKRIYIYVVDTGDLIVLNESRSVIEKSDTLKLIGSEDDVAIMLHTSGTTSNPKRVMLSHKNIICNIESNIKSLKLSSADKVLIALPMFFGYCNTAQFLTHLYLGATIVILDSVFLPKQFFQIVQTEKITNFTGVPSMLLMLLDYKYSNNYDYSSLKILCFGGGNMPKSKLEQLIKKYRSVGFVQTYGQTECSPRVTALLPEDSLRKLGSVGLPIDGVSVKVVDGNTNPMANNEIGEIIVNGKNVMKGYYKQPEMTKNTIKNGWLHTGDLGSFDDEGYLYLAGRIKNTIISGGINIYPDEIEEILLEHENVVEACVYSEDDDMLGEVPVAKVVLKDKQNVNDLREFCKIKLSRYKIPYKIYEVDKLDKTYNGKIKRY